MMNSSKMSHSSTSLCSPLIKAFTPWGNLDWKNELIYQEAVNNFGSKLFAEMIVKQNRLDLWTPKSGAYSTSKGRYLKSCHKPKNNNGIYSVRLTWDCSKVIIGYENGLVEILDLLTDVVVVVKEACNSSKAVSTIKLHPAHNCFYFSSTKGIVFMCKFLSDSSQDGWGTSKIINEGKNSIYGMDINCDGKRLITGGKDSRLRVYDTETSDIVTCYKGFTLECKDSYARLLEEDEEEGHYLQIYSVVCHPDNPSIFASAGLDSNIKIWDLRVSQFAVKNIYGPRIMGDAIDLLDNKVLSGQWASTDGLQIWDAGSCRLLNTFRPLNHCPQSFGQFMYCSKFMKNVGEPASGDLVLAGGAGLGGLMVVSIEENLILALYEEDESVLTLDNKGGVLVYGGTNNVLNFSQFVHESVEIPSDIELNSQFYCDV